MTRPNPFLELRKELPVIFWPILYWSLKWFMGYVAELRAAGHEHIRWHVTWYGKIKVTWVDEVDPLRALRALPSWQELQARDFSTPWTTLSADTCVGRYPWKPTLPLMRWVNSALWIPAYAGIGGVWGSGSKLEPG